MNYFFWRIGDFFKRIFLGLIENIVAVTIGALETVRYLLFKICMLALVFTNIGFVIGLVLLVLNIIEATKGVFITQTKYFIPMIVLFVAHIVLFSLCRILKPKDL